MLFILYEIASIIIFVQVNDRYTEDSANVILWKKNYKDGGCGELEMTYSLQNACLNGCGYQAFFVVLYICTLYRTNIMQFLFTDDANKYPI